MSKENASGSSMAAGEAHRHEQAAYFYAYLADALSLAPAYEDVYRAYRQTYKKILNDNTSFRNIHFAGAFAQTDYLLKELGASMRLRMMVNDARSRLRRFGQGRLSAGELQSNYLYDFEALCRLVALVYHVGVPASLEQNFLPPRQLKARRLMAEEMRFMADSWDDTYLYGQLDGDDSSSVAVCYASGNRSYPYDRSYLPRLLYRNAQLNLVRPREGEGGVIYPELIILEPDYLVDITTIASCFEQYGHSALNNIIHRLSPNVTTAPILLGNFAGQMLDEEMRSQNLSYGESAQRFFARNAVSLLSASLTDAFHNDARQQQRHIHELFQDSVIKRVVREFERDNVVLEPSFFSPMLGLQGRMDLLQMDMRFLIEQKSGKAAFPEPQHPGEKVLYQQKHYVQMLLYMTLIRYNYRVQYEHNNRNLQEFLLYSKYADSLCGLGFAPALVFEAMKLRNELVAQDLRLDREGYQMIDSLTADSLNQKGVNNKLWNNYQKPQIDNILSAIHRASPLEKEYFFRMLTFIGNEQLLAKLGNRVNDHAGFAATWLESLEEKRQAGNIYDNLTLMEPNHRHRGEVERVVMRFEESRDNDMSNFRKGDIVILYPYERGRQPMASQTMVIRCTIADIRTDAIVLHLRAPQSDARVFVRFAKWSWAIEHDYIESSFGSRFKSMQAFLTAPKERRDLILLQRRPEVDTSRQLMGDYGPFNNLSLRVKQAKDMFLIIGPPGTGKTSFGMLNTLKEELLSPEARVLLVSYTNRAVDEMCSKLIEEHIDFIRIGKQLSAAKEIVPYLLESKVSSCRNIAQLRSIVAGARVMAGTTTSLSASIEILRQHPFTLAIVDEASQILEPDLMALLSVTTAEGKSAIRKFVFIGDHKQLPAVVQQSVEVSRVHSELLRGIGLKDCRLSLFERLLGRYRDDPSVTYMLTKQGRMHQDIAMFPNQAFYNNKLEVVPLDHQLQHLPAAGTGSNGIVDLLTTRRIAFVAVSAPSRKEYISDKVNRPEAEVIAQTAYEIYNIYKQSGKEFLSDETLGIIVPYRNQIAAIRNILDEKYGIAAIHDITIDTVERYQGSQRDYIIYGFTIQKRYQLDFLTSNTFEEDGAFIDRKLNVAMTRAREHLLMVGDPQLLRHNVTFSSLIDFVRNHQGYFSMPVSKYIAGAFHVPPLTPNP